jgi:NADPH2:quinone reductase
VKAIQAAGRGGYDALRLIDIPRPRPRAGQVLVRVTSAGVTPLDRTVLAGLPPRASVLALVPGNEGAGVVIEDPSEQAPEALRHLTEDRPFGKVTLSVGAIRPATGPAAGSKVRSAVGRPGSGGR